MPCDNRIKAQNHWYNNMNPYHVNIGTWSAFVRLFWHLKRVQTVYLQQHRNCFLVVDSWHEIGISDLPACIDYVLQKTGHKDLIYIAHSQGTTAFFVLMSQRPEYNQKVKAMFAMAPVAFLNEIKSFPLRVISLATSQIGVSTDWNFHPNLS